MSGFVALSTPHATKVIYVRPKAVTYISEVTQPYGGNLRVRRLGVLGTAFEPQAMIEIEDTPENMDKLLRTSHERIGLAQEESR